MPTPAHAEVGLRALGAGRAVLMEKPLAATLDQADALVDEAARRGVPLLVGHVERFNRAIRAARPYLGEPRYLESDRLAPFQPRGTDVAVVLDLMIHDLDLILHLTGGAPVGGRAGQRRGGALPHLDMANARVEFATGAVANVTASRMARERVRRLRIFQPDGYLSLDLGDGTGKFMRLRDGWRESGGTAARRNRRARGAEAPERRRARAGARELRRAVPGRGRGGRHRRGGPRRPGAGAGGDRGGPAPRPGAPGR